MKFEKDAEGGQGRWVGPCGWECVSISDENFSLLGNFNLILDEYNPKYIEEVNGKINFLDIKYMLSSSSSYCFINLADKQHLFHIYILIKIKGDIYI